MREYLNVLEEILQFGEERENRTGVDTLQVFGTEMRFDLSTSFPLVTTKKVFFKAIVHELLWFISGSTNIKYLVDNGVHIWDDWADQNGELGPVYGKQLRHWKGHSNHYPVYDPDNIPKPIDRYSNLETVHIGAGYKDTLDQLNRVICDLKTDPFSRRHVIVLWNPAEVGIMALPPCHGNHIHFNVSNEGELSCKMVQRSADMFLGVPFNIASYALFTCMIAQVCNLTPGELIISLNDSHIYKNHIDQIKEQLKRDPYPLPKLKLNPNIKNIDDFKYEDIELIDYKYHPAIKGEVAV